jgi:hypothetical protein
MAKEPTHTQHLAQGHHVKAAEHLEQASKHHNEAAGHSAAGHHETAAHHAHSAHAHMLHAAHHASEAAKAHRVHQWRYSDRSRQAADFATVLKTIIGNLGIDMPYDNKNSGQALSQTIAEKVNPVSDVV